MNNTSVVELQTIENLLRAGGPVPDALRDRISCDLDEVQMIALTLRKLCAASLGEDGWDVAEFTTVADAMAYRIGRILYPWTNTGAFSDDKERRIVNGDGESHHG